MPVRITDRAREIGDVLLANRAALDGDLRLRGVVHVAVVVLRIEYERVETVLLRLVHDVGPTHARVRAGDEESAKRFVLRPTEALFLRIARHGAERVGDLDLGSDVPSLLA